MKILNDKSKRKDEIPIYNPFLIPIVIEPLLIAIHMGITIKILGAPYENNVPKIWFLNVNHIWIIIHWILLTIMIIYAVKYFLKLKKKGNRIIYIILIIIYYLFFYNFVYYPFLYN